MKILSFLLGENMSGSTEITRKKCGQIYILSNEKFSLICDFCEREFFELEVLRTHLADHFPEESKFKIEKYDIDSISAGTHDDIIELTSESSDTELEDAPNFDDKAIVLRLDSNKLSEEALISEQNNGSTARYNLKECSVVLPRIIVTECPNQSTILTEHRRESVSLDDENQTDASRTSNFVSVPKISDGSFPKVLQKGFKCSFCPRIFRQRRDHNNHENTHTGRRPHKCRICFKTYSSILVLNSHLNVVHIKERKFKCTMCIKSYITKCDLDNHAREKHLPDSDPRRYFPCQLCEHKARTAFGLRYHTKASHPKSVVELVCDHCKRKFTSRTSLQKHMKNIHSGRTPSQCSYCHKTFTSIKGKNYHERNFCGSINTLNRLTRQAEVTTRLPANTYAEPIYTQL